MSLVGGIVGAPLSLGYPGRVGKGNGRVPTGLLRWSHMEFFSRLNPRQQQVMRVTGMAVLGVAVLSVVVRVVGSPAGLLGRPGLMGEVGSAIAPALPYQEASYATVGSAAMDKAGGWAPTLSARNVAPMPPSQPGSVSGNDAEAFEVTHYRAQIETRDLGQACDQIAGWKGQSYVIFERANRGDRTCDFRFKVERARVDEVLGRLQALKPKELTQDTETIKREVSDFTSELDILQKKQRSIDSTLDSATRAYDEISTLATRTQDAASLARVIEAKLQTIERLTAERLAVNEQVDRLQRLKAERLDQLDYTYFSVDVYERPYLDGKQLKESWQAAVREFVRTVNQIAQDLTLGLVALAVFAAQYVVYLLLAVLLAKYVWKVVRAIWKA